MTVDTLPATTGNGLARALPGIMPDVTNEALDRLARWVDAAQHAHKLVAPLVGTPWVPAAYQPKVDPRASEEDKAAAYQVAVASATAAVLYGSSLGIDPLMALQQVYVVSGRPALYAKMMVALVQSQGHEVWTEDQTDTRAVVCGRRKGSSHTERITITMDMARKAGWTRNTKYSETPQDMLWARAASRVCDRIASDVLKGIPSVEEAQDDAIVAQATTGPATRTVAPRRRAEAAPAAIAAAEEPELEPEPSTMEEPAAEPEPIDIGDAPEAATPAQTRKLYALLRDTGRAEKADALKYLSLFLDRDVESTKTLSKAEARVVIDDLEAQAAQQTEPGDEQPELEP